MSTKKEVEGAYELFCYLNELGYANKIYCECDNNPIIPCQSCYPCGFSCGLSEALCYSYIVSCPPDKHSTSLYIYIVYILHPSMAIVLKTQES